MGSEGKFVELVKIGDPIQADLFATFLDDAEVQFMVANRVGAAMMSSLMPRAQQPVIVMIHEDDLEQGIELLAEYRKEQSGEIVWEGEDLGDDVGDAE